MSEKKNPIITPYNTCLRITCCSDNEFLDSGLDVKLPIKINPKKKQAIKLMIIISTR